MEINCPKNLIINLFLSICDYEKKLMIQRCRLNQNFCFNTPFGYFNYLDKYKKNYLDFNDISSFLSLGKIKFRPLQIKQIIKLYDKDNDYCWNFEEYSSFIKVNYELNNSSNSNATLYKETALKSNELSGAIEHYEKELIELFKIEIQFIEYSGIKIKGIKQLENYQFNIQNIYKEIKGKYEQIDLNCLFFFINDGKHSISNEDAKLIINKIGNGNIISFKNLENFLTFDKYIKDKDTQYIHTKGYYPINPIDHSKLLYYNAFINQGKNTNINEKVINDNISKNNK